MSIVMQCTTTEKKEGPQQGLVGDFQWLAYTRLMKRNTA